MSHEKHSWRCTSCGYVQLTEPGTVLVEDVPVVLPAEPVPVVAPVVQQSRCPLCGCLFTDPAQYAAHRENNCADAPPENPVEETPPAPADSVEWIADSRTEETEGPIAP